MRVVPGAANGKRLSPATPPHPAPAPLPAKLWHPPRAPGALGCPPGSPATCTATGSRLDTVVASQGKSAWEMPQKEVEEAFYLQFAFKHNTDGLSVLSSAVPANIPLPRESNRAAGGGSSFPEAQDRPILAQGQKSERGRFTSGAVSPSQEPALGDCTACTSETQTCSWLCNRVTLSPGLG